MGRSVLAILAGPVVFGMVYVPGNLAVLALWPDLVRPDGTSDHVGILLLYLVLYLGDGGVAGFATAVIARRSLRAHAGILALLQLIIVVSVQSYYWDRMPVWFSLSFFAVVPVGILLGAEARRRQTTAPATA